MVELLVVISIIALLMAILLPTLNKVRRYAKTIACRSNLRQWSVFFSMYADENHDGMPTMSMEWADALRAYSPQSDKLRYCPMATKFVSEGGRHPFAAFEAFSASWDAPIIAGSYGINGWVCNPPPEVTINAFGLPTTNNWRKVDVHGASNVPLLLDSMWIDSYPDTNNVPPPFDGDFSGSFPIESKQIRFFCINRHDGFINCVFLDSSVRKVGLKELWKLKWHRNSDLNAPTPQWPDWMKKFKDY